MWIILIFLWIIPIALGTLAFARIIDGMPALKENERNLLFDETKETEVGIWLAVTFAALAIVFFLLGLVQGIILPNLSSFWLIAPLLTSSAAVVFLILWLRSAPPQSQGFQRGISRMHTRAARMVDTLFR